MGDITVAQGIIISIFGICMVFVILVILMTLVRLMTKAFKTAAPEPVSPSVVEAVSNIPQVPANGSFGDVMLFDVPASTAAMLMAIVADEMKLPLNKLRFISIREISENDDGGQR